MKISVKITQAVEVGASNKNCFRRSTKDQISDFQI